MLWCLSWLVGCFVGWWWMSRPSCCDCCCWFAWGWVPAPSRSSENCVLDMKNSAGSSTKVPVWEGAKSFDGWKPAPLDDWFVSGLWSQYIYIWLITIIYLNYKIYVYKDRALMTSSFQGWDRSFTACDIKSQRGLVSKGTSFQKALEVKKTVDFKKSWFSPENLSINSTGEITFNSTLNQFMDLMTDVLADFFCFGPERGSGESSGRHEDSI